MTHRNIPTRTTSRTSATSAASESNRTSATSNASRRMTDAEVAWIREHAWTKAMLNTAAPRRCSPCARVNTGHEATAPLAHPHQGRQATIYDFLDANATN